MPQKRNIGLIILAAGASTRLGSPKQLLNFDGETFLRRVALEALKSICQPLVAVFGANAENIESAVEDLAILSVKNDDWENGMQTSIRVGIKKLLQIDTRISGAIVAVCDQPFVTRKIFDELAKEFEENDALIVASRYAETVGVPALFSQTLFPDLKNLDERGGAKNLIKKYLDQTITIDFPEGEVDIDTPEDFERLEERRKTKS